MLLTFNDVFFSYNNREDVLQGVTFSMVEGEKVALIGLNGAGKSTLLLHTNGLLLPTKGKVIIKGMNTKSKQIKEIRKKVGMIFQNPDDQLFMPTVREDVAFGPMNMNLSEKEIDEKVDAALTLTHTNHLSEKSPFELSGGEKKMVSIATVLSMSPELIVMDEPTSGLDNQARENVISIIETLPQGFLISTHDLELAQRVADRILVLKDGRLKDECL